MTEKKSPKAAGSDAEKTPPKATSKATPKPRATSKKKRGAKAAQAEAAEKLRKDADAASGDEGQARREKIREEMRRQIEEDRRALEEEDRRWPMLPSIKKEPHRCAEIVLERFFTKDGMTQVRYYRENWYCYHKSIWRQRTEKEMRAFVHSYLRQCRTQNSDGMPQDFPASTANVTEVLNQISAFTTILDDRVVPVFHFEPGMPSLDPMGKMVTPGWITDMLTGEKWLNHEVFVPNGAEWIYDPKAKPPKAWHKFLDQLFADRDEERKTLLEYMGYVLSGDTWAQKGLLLVGPKRAGKGIIGGVLRKLLGASMVASPSLKSMGENFGLENLVDKRLCLISDARLSKRADIMSVIEMLLRIIANDPVDVTRKHKTALTLKLGTRVMMLANSLPPLGDDSDAITSRFLIIQLTESFYGKEDTKLDEKLEKELPGIALEAIEAYARLMKRGKFLEPESSSTARAEWYTDNNPVAEFLEDCCVVDRGAKVEMSVLADAYEEWREVHKLPVMANHVLSRKVAAILGPKINRVAGDDGRRIEGLGLKPPKERKGSGF